MRIVREQPVTRTLRFLPVPALLSLLREGQEQYKANGTLPDALNETEFFWQTQKAQVGEEGWVGGWVVMWRCPAGCSVKVVGNSTPGSEELSGCISIKGLDVAILMATIEQPTALAGMLERCQASGSLSYQICRY
jgi:hypothetical protein